MPSLTCPTCGAELEGGLERCPVCDAGAAPRVEGALARRPEPMREIPGLRKRERTWRDEVQDRVRSRREKRASAGLPLFDGVDPAPSEPRNEAALPGAVQPPPTAEAVRPEPRTGEPVLRARPTAIPDEPESAGLEDLPLARAERAPGPTPPPSATPAEAEPRPSDDFVAVRLSDAELGDLPLQARAASADAEAEARAAALPRATRRAMPSLEEDALLDGELPGEPELELPPLAVEAPPLERPAHALERAQAAAVDALLFAGLVMLVLYFTGRAARAPVVALWPSWPGLALYFVVLGLFYAAYFTGTTGQTPGKLLTGLRVVGSTGRPPSYARAMARALLGLVGIVLAGASLLPMAFDPARRTLHDRLFRTRVVRG
jgi:uncharacterized RDD family membrane protein YckC